MSSCVPLLKLQEELENIFILKNLLLSCLKEQCAAFRGMSWCICWLILEVFKAEFVKYTSTSCVLDSFAELRAPNICLRKSLMTYKCVKCDTFVEFRARLCCRTVRYLKFNPSQEAACVLVQVSLNTDPNPPSYLLTDEYKSFLKWTSATVNDSNMNAARNANNAELPFF